MVTEIQGNVRRLPHLTTPPDATGQKAAQLHVQRPAVHSLVPDTAQHPTASAHIFSGNLPSNAPAAQGRTHRHGTSAAALAEAAGADIRSYWGNLVEFRKGSPSPGHVRPALWLNSPWPGFSGHVPGVGHFQVQDLHQAAVTFSQHGIQPLVQQRHYLADAAAQLWGDQVLTFSERPKGRLDRPALWFSSSRSGGISGFTPQGGHFRVSTFDEAAEMLARHGVHALASQPERQAFALAVDQHWNGQVHVLDGMPPPAYPRPAVWATPQGEVGLQIPGFQPVGVRTMVEAQQLLAAHGIHPGQAAGPVGSVDGRSPLTSPAQLAELERTYGIQITPISVRGTTAAYLFSANGQAHRNVMLACHGRDANLGHFIKPRQLELNQGSPHGTNLLGYASDYAAKLKNNKVNNNRAQILMPNDRYAVNYMLSGTTTPHDGPPLPEVAAQIVSDVYRNPGKRQFDVIVIEPAVGAVSFSDLMEGIGQRLGPDTHKKMFCHFCTGQDEYAPPFAGYNNYVRMTRSPAFELI